MDIDLVYMWVDGNDPDWQKKKACYADEDRNRSEETSGKCRYVQNDELKYSLRSVEEYAPWIHRVFIVTEWHAHSAAEAQGHSARILALSGQAHEHGGRNCAPLRVVLHESPAP